MLNARTMADFKERARPVRITADMRAAIDADLRALAVRHDITMVTLWRIARLLISDPLYGRGGRV